MLPKREFTENTEHRTVRKNVDKVRSRLKSTVTLSSVSVPLRDKKVDRHQSWKYDQDCFSVSKVMIRLLRHGQSVNREKKGAVRFDDIMEEFKKKGWCSVMVHWRWSIHSDKGRRTKEKFNNTWILSLFSTSCISQLVKEIQKGTLLILSWKTTYWYQRISLDFLTRWNVSELYSRIRKDWSREEEVSKRKDNQYFSLQWIGWIVMIVRKILHTAWTMPQNTIYRSNLQIAQ